MRALHAIWVAAMTLALFSLTSSAIFAVWAFNNPAFPAEAKCIITSEQFFKYVASTGDYMDPQEMPPKHRAGFIRAFNEAPPKSGPADGVTVFQHKEIPMLQVVFTKGKCYASSFQMPMPAFLGMLQRSQGDAI